MSSDELTLREADHADVLTVMAMGEPASLNNWTESDFNSVLDGDTGRVMLAYTDNVLVGFVASSSVIDEVTLLNVAVHRRYRRRGIARVLIRDMLAQRRANGAGRCFLEVRDSNRSARALYESLGFVVDGMRPDYYRHEEGREDGVLMSLRLEVAQ